MARILLTRLLVEIITPIATSHRRRSSSSRLPRRRQSALQPFGWPVDPDVNWRNATSPGDAHDDPGAPRARPPGPGAVVHCAGYEGKGSCHRSLLCALPSSILADRFGREPLLRAAAMLSLVAAGYTGVCLLYLKGRVSDGTLYHALCGSSVLWGVFMGCHAAPLEVRLQVLAVLLRVRVPHAGHDLRKRRRSGPTVGRARGSPRRASRN